VAVFIYLAKKKSVRSSRLKPTAMRCPVKMKFSGETMFKLKTIVLAMAAVGCVSPLAVNAQTNEEMMRQLQALKAQVERLEAALKEQQTKTQQLEKKPDPVDPGEFNRVRVKTEALEDATEALGFKNLKISGVMDPTFMVNRARKTAGVTFLNNFTGDGANADVFAYDNSFFGTAMIDFQKEIDGGTKFRLTLAPHKSTGSGWNIGSIVHEASVSVPLTDLQTRLIAGQMPDWTGYEYYWPHQTKLITHNMLFDFTAPNFYQLVGLEFIRGKWWTRVGVGNMNKVSGSLTPGQKDPILTYRVDYSRGEFQGFGFTGQHGKHYGTRIDMFEADAYFVRGDVNWFGQVSVGRNRNAAANGGTASWAGFSTTLGYKVTPRFEAVARADIIRNAKNGGGLLGQVPGTCEIGTRDAAGAFDGGLTEVACNDGRNGFGPIMAYVDDGAGSSQWEPLMVNGAMRGATRSSLTLGFNYLFAPNTTLKAEYRLDRANGPAFLYTDGSYRKTNSLFGLGVVVSF
jgi:hypothetical protein